MRLGGQEEGTGCGRRGAGIARKAVEGVRDQFLQIWVRSEGRGNVWGGGDGVGVLWWVCMVLIE